MIPAYKFVSDEDGVYCRWLTSDGEWLDTELDPANADVIKIQELIEHVLYGESLKPSGWAWTW